MFTVYDPNRPLEKGGQETSFTTLSQAKQLAKWESLYGYRDIRDATGRIVAMYNDGRLMRDK